MNLKYVVPAVPGQYLMWSCAEHVSDHYLKEHWQVAQTVSCQVLLERLPPFLNFSAPVF